MLRISDVVDLTNKHISDGNLKLRLLNSLGNETNMTLVYTYLRGMVVAASTNDTVGVEKVVAVAAMTGVSADYHSGVEDITIGLKYINKYWR